MKSLMAISCFSKVFCIIKTKLKILFFFGRLLPAGSYALPASSKALSTDSKALPTGSDSEAVRPDVRTDQDVTCFLLLRATPLFIIIFLDLSRLTT